MKIPENKYLGTLCKRGHEYEGTGKSLRFITHGCVLCSKEYVKNNIEAVRAAKTKYRKNNISKISEYRKKNKEILAKRAKVFRETNLTKIKKRQQEYYAENRTARIAYQHNRRALESKEERERRRKRARDWKRNHPEQNLISDRKARKRASASLADHYVKTQLIKRTGLKRSQIPQELVEVKRLQIKIRRVVNQKKKEMKSDKEKRNINT